MSENRDIGPRGRQGKADGSHAIYRALLERHLDGELGPADRERLFAHMEFCDECREMLEAEERLIDRLSQVPRLVAPSDLRASILREALREQSEMSKSIAEEERYDGLLRATAGGSDSEEGIPLFAGSRRRARRGPLREAWRRYSPRVAGVFLLFAASSALYRGDFSSVPPLAEAQSLLRSGVGKVAEAAVIITGNSKKRQPDVIADNDSATAPRRPSESNQVGQPGKSVPASASLPAIAVNPRARQTGLYVAHKIEALQRAIADLADTARDIVPKPAELTGAVTAIVLKATDHREAYGLDPDEFGNSFSESAQAQLGGKVSTVDQFAYEGHRYRCYELQVSGGRLDDLVASLGPYRSAPDETIVRALNEQRGSATPLSAQTAFFAASGHDFQSAVRNVPAKPDGNHDKPARKVRIFFVE